MRLALIGLVLSFGSVACGSGSQPARQASVTPPSNVAGAPAPDARPEPPRPARPEPCSDDACGVRGMEFYAEEMCRCGTDEKCALAIEEESRKWSLRDTTDMAWFTSEPGQAAYGRFLDCFQTARRANRSAHP